MTNERPPGRPLVFMPRYTVEGVDVASTLISSRSRARAFDIRQYQGTIGTPQAVSASFSDVSSGTSLTAETLRLIDRVGAIYERAPDTPLPERYVIAYYMPTRRGDPISSKLQHSFSLMDGEQVVAPDGIRILTMPLIHPGNPALPLTPSMQHAVTQAFTAIEAQLPGRFRFVRVDHPADANINFASAPTMVGDIALTVPDEGSILLNRQYLTGRENANVAHVAMHEIGHALGLEHPHNHQKPSGVPSTEKATFFDTVMTYFSNNRAQAGGAKAFATSLMPADLQALQRLYPVQGDLHRDMTKVAPAPVGTASHDFKVILEQAGRMTAIPVAREGVTYHPVQDTANDTVRITDTTGGRGATKVTFEQTLHGLTIRSEGGQGELLLPIRAEQVTVEQGTAAQGRAHAPVKRR